MKIMLKGTEHDVCMIKVCKISKKNAAVQKTIEINRERDVQTEAEEKLDNLKRSRK